MIYTDFFRGPFVVRVAGVAACKNGCGVLPHFLDLIRYGIFAPATNYPIFGCNIFALSTHAFAIPPPLVQYSSLTT